MSPNGEATSRLERGGGSALLIVADDYGYAPGCDAGIVAAARGGGIDAVSAMALRGPDPATLRETGVDVGLHLELEGTELDPAAEAIRQLERFRALFEAEPTHIDGHHHCHAAAGPAALATARLARRLELPLRSVDARHRRLLRCLGVATAERLLGRLDERQPALPVELAAWLAGEPAPAGVSEWMVHPGRAGTSSRYDRGREQDLALLLELGDRSAWAARGIRRIGPGELRAEPAATPIAPARVRGPDRS